jgi:integrase
MSAATVAINLGVSYERLNDLWKQRSTWRPVEYKMKHGGDSVKRRQRGAGSIFRKGTCKKWVIQFYKDGRRVREATGTTEWAEAAILLRQRLNEVAKDEYTVRSRTSIRIEDLYKSLQKLTAICLPTRPRELPGRWLHLKPAFATKRARELRTEDVNDYILARQRAGAANATINRELATLKRMFRVAMQEEKIERVPHIPMLKETNVRTGFVDYAAFQRLQAAAEREELWLRIFLELGFTYGWRRGEMLGLRVRRVNLAAHTIRLDTGSTKNGEGREVTMNLRVEALLRQAVTGREPEDYVRRRTNGGQVKEFRRTWNNLTKRAGLPGLLVHDLRRSAAKALRKAGVPESVIMATGGWLTSSMFRRYAIVSSSDQRDAMEKLELDRAKDAKNSPLLSPFLESGISASNGKVQ